MGRRAPRGGDLGRLLDDEIYPALFERLDGAFPEFRFERRGDHWVARDWPPDFPTTVNGKRPDRLVVYPDRPHWIKVHGHTGVRFLDLVNQGRRPAPAEFIPAVRKLAELAGVVFPERDLTPQQAEDVRKREARRSALDAVIEYTQEVLGSVDGKDAREYLWQRGFTPEDISDLGFGFYDSASRVRHALKEREQDLEVAKAAGLTWRKLEGYITIPWLDAAGQPLTLYGRWAGKNPPARRPKTLALPGEGTKGSPLYFDRARAAGLKAVVAVEGVFDGALLQARGDRRVVAYVAAQFSGQQIKTMRRYGVGSVVICPDPDGGGDRGALASVKALAAAGITPHVAPRLPDGVDPDEFVIREGIYEWREHVARAISGALHVARVGLEGIEPSTPELRKREALEAVACDVQCLLNGPWGPMGAQEVTTACAAATGWSSEALQPLFSTREPAEDSPEPMPDEGDGDAVPSSSSDPFPVIRACDVQPRDVEFLVDDHIPVSSCGFGSGPSGCDKTWLMLEFAVAVASGTPAAGGHATRQGTVLVFNAEDDPATVVRKRLDALARGRGMDLADLPIYLINISSLRLDLAEHVSRLTETVRASNARLLILDPLRNLHWRNEDSSTDMTPILDGLRGIQRETGASVLLVHHDRKANKSDREGGRREDRTRGSNALEGWRDFALYLDKRGETVTVKPYVKAAPPLGAWTFQLVEADEGIHLAASSQASGLREEVLASVRDHPEGLTRSEIRNIVGKARFGVKRVLDGLIRQGVVAETAIIRTRKDGKALPITVLVLASQQPLPGNGSLCPAASEPLPAPYRGAEARASVETSLCPVDGGER